MADLFNLTGKRPAVDSEDPLLHGLRAALDGKFIGDVRTNILGSDEKYNLAMLAPWSDISSEEDAKAVAKSTLETLHADNEKKFKILDPSRRVGEVTIIANCDRGLNGKTDDNDIVVSRSLANPVDGKFLRLICEALHEEIRKDIYKDQMIIVSLSACTYESNEAGNALQGINGVIACRDEQRIFSNKSDNLYAIQHCDFTEEAKDAMQSYSYHEFSVLHKKAPQEGGGNFIAMFVGPDEERTHINASDVVPPGTEAADLVSIQPNRGTNYEGGVHLIATRPSASNYDNVATRPRAHAMMTNDIMNPITGRANHTLLRADAGFLNSIRGRTAAENRELMETAKLLSISPPGSVDAVFAHSMLNFSRVTLQDYHDYIVMANHERGAGHSLFQRVTYIPADNTMTNGGRAEQYVSGLAAALFDTPEQLQDVNAHINDNQAREGWRAITRPGEAFAEGVAADQEMANRNEAPRARAAAFMSRTRTQAQDVATNPTNYPRLPVQTEQVVAWSRGNLNPATGNGGAAGREPRGSPTGGHVTEEERARDRREEEQRRREREREDRRHYDGKR